MRSTRIKPISYFKANAAEVLHRVEQEREPFVITQNGEAKAVLLDIASYEKSRETLALLKILALGNEQLARGQVVSAASAIAGVRARRGKRE